jgi:hypothetical protein
LVYLSQKLMDFFKESRRQEEASRVQTQKIFADQNCKPKF